MVGSLGPIEISDQCLETVIDILKIMKRACPLSDIVQKNVVTSVLQIVATLFFGVDYR